MGQVIEDEDEVRLDEGGHRHADRVALRQRDRGFEAGDRVVGDGPDAAAGEPGHVLRGCHAAARDEPADRGQGIAGRRARDRQVWCVGRDGDRTGLDAGDAVADLEQAPRTDPQERVAPETLAALDRLEEIGWTAVVEAQEGTDRGLEVGRTRGTQHDRVRVGGDPLRLGQADRFGGGHRRWPRESENDHSSRDERSCLPRCHPHSAVPHFVTDGPLGVATCRPIGAALYRWRSAPEPTDSVARAASCSVRRLPGPFPAPRRSGSHQPPDLWVDVLRVLVPFTARCS